MKEQLVAMLADYLRISDSEAKTMLAHSNIGKELSNPESKIQYQDVHYVFDLLKGELNEEDQDPEDDFERPEELPEGEFVRSH